MGDWRERHTVTGNWTGREGRFWAVSRKTFALAPSGRSWCTGCQLTCAVAIKNGTNYKGTLAVDSNGEK